MEARPPGARSILQLIDTVRLLDEGGVQRKSLTENIDTRTPAGKPTFHIFATLAEFERGITRRRGSRRAQPLNA